MSLPRPQTSDSETSLLGQFFGESFSVPSDTNSDSAELSNLSPSMSNLKSETIQQTNHPQHHQQISSRSEQDSGFGAGSFRHIKILIFNKNYQTRDLTSDSLTFCKKIYQLSYIQTKVFDRSKPIQQNKFT